MYDQRNSVSAPGPTRFLNSVMRAATWGLLSACAAGAITSPARADIPVLQKLTLSPGGVDLSSNTYMYEHEDLSLGELKLVRHWHGLPLETPDYISPSENGFSHNLHMLVTVELVQPWEDAAPSQLKKVFYVHIGEAIYIFQKFAGSSVYAEIGLQKGQSLAQSTVAGEGLIFTDRYDTKYRFSPIGTQTAGVGYVAAVSRADGHVMNFTYSGSLLKLVKDNKGSALAFNHSGSKITKVCAINLAITTYSAGTTCPTSVPSATYSYPTRSYTYTGPDGRTFTFTAETTASGAIHAITLPGSSSPWMTWKSTTNGWRQDFADGSWFLYGSGYTTAAGATSVTFSSGGGQRIYWDQENPWAISSGPAVVTDPLNRTISTDYCRDDVVGECYLTASPISRTFPEGDKVEYSYDATDNPVQATYKAKPGSGLADRVVLASYATSTGARTKPVSVTDARGNITEFTYDTVHGGVLTETGPAPATGQPRPQTRYSYVQRSAWVANGSGGYTQAASPVWLLASKSLCKTSAATGNTSAPCTISGDEVRTTYDYGPDSGPNLLLLRGVVEDAGGLSLRTCYGYDALGRKISETRPRAGLTSCP
jgi:hypothetical protein